MEVADLGRPHAAIMHSQVPAIGLDDGDSGDEPLGYGVLLDACGPARIVALRGERPRLALMRHVLVKKVGNR